MTFLKYVNIPLLRYCRIPRGLQFVHSQKHAVQEASDFLNQVSLHRANQQQIKVQCTSSFLETQKKKIYLLQNTCLFFIYHFYLLQNFSFLMKIMFHLHVFIKIHILLLKLPDVENHIEHHYSYSEGFRSCWDSYNFIHLCLS